MTYRVGRFLQMLGMLIAPIGMAGNIINPDAVSLGTSLSVAVFGAVIFAIGWSIARPAA